MMGQSVSNVALLGGLKKQLQKVLFNQQQLLAELEKNSLVPEHNSEKPLVFDSKTIPEMKSVLQGEYTKLENFEVVLAVVGTMKAGKSTTINAIVGREILPNRNRPMTSLPTLIAHSKGQKEPTLTCNVKSINDYISKLKKLQLMQYAQDERVSSYKEIVGLIKNIQAGYKFKNNYKGEEAIFSFLASLNDLVRLSRIIVDDYPEFSFPFSAYKEINSLPRINVEFTELAQQDEQLGNLVLLDTPGPNEANLPELKEIFEQQLKRSSAVMVVMDYTQLKSQADADIREELDKLPKIEKDRLFALVNKFDQKNANGDDQDTTKSIVHNDLLKDKIHSQNIYCISAQDAFLATRIENYINLYQEKPNFDEMEWVQDFAKKAFGTRAKRMWESSELHEILEDSQSLATDSQMALPLENVIQESYKNAPQIAMQSALRDVDNIFTNIANYFSVHGYFNKEYQMTEEELNKLKESLSKLDKDRKLLKEHADTSLVKVNKTIKKSSEEISEKFKKFEEDSPSVIKSEIYRTIKLFTERKEEEYDNRVGRSNLGKVYKFLILNENYAKDKSKLKAELDDLQKAFVGGVIKLKKNEMEQLNLQIEQKTQLLELDFKQSLEAMLNPILKDFNFAIQKINTEIIGDISKISQEFGKAGIEIKLSPLDINFTSTQASMKINFSELSTEKMEIRRIESTSTFAGARRWAGKFFNTDWGYETIETVYKELSFNQLNQELEKMLLNFLVGPIQVHLEKCFKEFNAQLEIDLNIVTKQVEELINELQVAYEAEQLPYEQKKMRKDMMNDIDKTNKSIQIEINTVKKYLPVILAGDVL
ncbi:dynamin family protein [Acinetobacter sp. NyZ410]|uniref:dynamin family protein n=1 Tax=Acinetobacter sp. NyZ410 TaxID=2929509 RepID=UPI001FBAB453|nr:dynamin family protein [Acinetobacter sp. NyZ410]UOH17791.1 dynamin family protein [Acinetobacter sp. NyZ410]